MHPLEQHYTGGSDYALASFGLEKIAIMSPAQRQEFMAARANRPTGLAAIQAQMQNPAAPPILPGASGLELDRSGFQGGHGTPGKMPGAQMGARGQVVGLPNKLAAFFL